MATLGELPIAVVGQGPQQPVFGQIDTGIEIATVFANVDLVPMRQLQENVAAEQSIVLTGSIELHLHSHHLDAGVSLHSGAQVSLDVRAHAVGQLHPPGSEIKLHPLILSWSPAGER
jgi:hypothetical protein